MNKQLSSVQNTPTLQATVPGAGAPSPSPFCSLPNCTNVIALEISLRSKEAITLRSAAILSIYGKELGSILLLQVGLKNIWI